jgi:phosphohistidine phosphatase
MAGWLEKRLPKDARVLVSPARRAQQTARALTRDFETRRELGTDADARAVLKAAGWPEAEGTVVDTSRRSGRPPRWRSPEERPTGA